MPDDDILQESVDRELKSMTILLTAKAARMTITLQELIQSSIVNGMDVGALEATLLNDLTLIK